jgi:hypothetical protein
MSSRISQAHIIDPMVRLQDRWYNSLTTSLNLSRQMFQISTPAAPLDSTDPALWKHQNLLPPRLLTFDNSDCTGDLFFNEYAAILSQIRFPMSSFQQDIGESAYQAWTSYLTTLTPPPASSQLPGLFQKWAIINAQSVRSVGVSDLAQMVLVNSANQAIQPYLGPNARLPDFNGTYRDLKEVVGRSSSVAFSFDSGGVSDDVGDTWAAANRASGLWRGSCFARRISSKFATSRITADVRFNGYLIWPSTPGEWYNSSLLNTAFSSRITPPWIENANPTWNDFFGEHGSLRRFISSLVVADGITVTINSDASYSEHDQQAIVENASSGLWPLYAPASGIVKNMARFDASGATLVIAVEPGNPVILGNQVLAVGSYLGH